MEAHPDLSARSAHIRGALVTFPLSPGLATFQLLVQNSLIIRCRKAPAPNNSKQRGPNL